MEIKNFINNRITSKTAKFDSHRKKTLPFKILRNALITIAVIFYLTVFAFNLIETIGLQDILVVGFLSVDVVIVVILLVIIAIANREYNKCNNNLKAKVIPIILKTVNPDFKYLGSRGISRKDFFNCGFTEYGYADKLEIEDVIIGSINGRNFKFGEITIGKNNFLEERKA